MAITSSIDGSRPTILLLVLDQGRGPHLRPRPCARMTVLSPTSRREMLDSPATPRVFLSFSTEHMPLVDLFRDQARDNCSTLIFRDYSIKEPVKGAWKRYAESRIRESSVTICLIGENTWRSEPVDWEIRRSADLGKRILAVYLQSSTARTPPALVEMGITPIPWDVETILNTLYDER